MPRSYSRSPSPRQEDRRRSRSPRRRDDGDGDRDRDRPRRREGGFRWKQKRRTDDDGRADEQRGLERGYRDTERGKERVRESEREGERTRSPTRDRRGDRYRDFDPDGDRRRHDGTNSNSYKDSRYRPTGTTTAPASSTGDRREEQDRKEKKREKREKDKKAAAVAAPTEPMIIVHVNDRLGTKAAIPCLASDPIRLFKAQVAARIGREPHEILLKRQGERPFKDQLTLEDYGVGNGVQLDLYVSISIFICLLIFASAFVPQARGTDVLPWLDDV
ncbi:hypothetical protein EMPG_10225 [Blastomyces silverae]|uniref:Ubiquitin-like modifier HUB1 n=1 Tax=Blastomyces silverae TaxID=2060906 RepID=A0A0H1BB12_9EURO|nr:hypothetical protein EMPG_10225 [Blastomyces silverae]